MEKYFALINKNIVQSVAVGDDAFLEHIKSKYDLIIDVTNIDRPSVDDSYYPDTKTFMSNSVNDHQIPVDLEAEHLKLGTEKGFEPFKLSKYSVKYRNGIVIIGCKRYSAPGLLDALHRGLIKNDRGTVHCFTTSSGNPAHGKFEITWNDAQKLYDALIKVKF